MGCRGRNFCPPVVRRRRTGGGKRFRNSALAEYQNRKIFISLIEKILGGAQLKNVKKIFLLCSPNRSGGERKRWAGLPPVGRQSKVAVRIFVKKSSDFNQKAPPIFTFCEIVRSCLGAKRLGMVFFRNLKGIFEIARQRAVGNAEVRRAKHGQNEILQTNLFSFAFSKRLSVFLPQGTLSCFAIHLVFDCPKANFKTIWTT